jgi:hypothetical protein
VFDTLNTGKLVFTSSDYEIDLMAQVQEVGGNGLTGVGVVFVMGPASETGNQLGCTGTNASDDIIYKFPNYEPARDPDTFLVLHDGAGNELFKNFARNPCTGSVVFSPDDPHSM